MRTEMVAGAGIEPALERLMRPPSYPELFPAMEHLAAATRLELVSSRLQDERSLYPFELRRRRRMIGGPGES